MPVVSEEPSALAPVEPAALAVEAPPPDPRAQRWSLLRDVFVLQAKLILEGLKDLVLGPIAIAAAFFGIAFEPKQPRRHFDALLRAGRDFERWVDLYGAADEQQREAQGLDAHVRKLEALVLEQHAKGGVTQKAKDAIDRAIESLHDGRER
ncbi:MAG TPA: hypothetical protein VG755_25875 [Nannocystaceae bacterium]|nr:hypothetical protein [Nannocystaceae bacterium]